MDDVTIHTGQDQSLQASPAPSEESSCGCSSVGYSVSHTLSSEAAAARSLFHDVAGRLSPDDPLAFLLMNVGRRLEAIETRLAELDGGDAK